MQQSGLHALTAKQLAAKGRGPDTMLVHMAPSEVNSLRGLAQHMGADLGTNPDTGLPEAGILSSVLPMVLGAALTATGVGAPLAAAMVGGGTGLITGDLNKGLMAGLGAYGGGALSGALGAGTAAAETAATTGAETAFTGGAEAAAQQAATGFTDLAANAGVTGAEAATPVLAPGAGGAGGLGSIPLDFAPPPAVVPPPPTGVDKLQIGIDQINNAPITGENTLGGVTPAGPAAPPPVEPLNAAAAPAPPAAPKDPGLIERFADEAKVGAKPSMLTTGAAGVGLTTPFWGMDKGITEDEDQGYQHEYKGAYTAGPRNVIAKDPNDTSTSEHKWFDTYMPEVLDAEGNPVSGKSYQDERPDDKKKKFAAGGTTSPGGKGAQSAPSSGGTSQPSWMSSYSSGQQSTPGGKGAQGGPPSGDTSRPAWSSQSASSAAPQQVSQQQAGLDAYSNFLSAQGGGGQGSQSLASQAAVVPDGTMGQAQALASEAGDPNAQSKSQSQALAALQAGMPQQGGDPNALPIGGDPALGGTPSPYSSPYTAFSQQQRMSNRNPHGMQRYTPMQQPPMQSAGSMGSKGANPGASSPSSYAEGGSVPKFAKGGTVNLKKGAFVLDARTVSEIGNGSSGAGLDVLKKRLKAKPVRGKGDGVSDDIAARIGSQPARVARDEAIVPPEQVARVGGGNPKKGAQKLYAMMDHAHKMRSSAKRGQDTKTARKVA